MSKPDAGAESLEGLDFELPCDIATRQALQVLGIVITLGPVTEKCKHPAVAILRCRGCRAVGLCCQPHLDGLLAMKNAICPGCLLSGNGLAIYVSEPLRVTS